MRDNIRREGTKGRFTASSSSAVSDPTHVPWTRWLGDLRRLEGQRSLVIQRRVTPLAVVERLHVVEQAGASLVTGLVVAMYDEFGLERVEEAFHRRVIPAVALATHALPDRVTADQFPVRGGRVGRALVRMQDGGWPA